MLDASRRTENLPAPPDPAVHVAVAPTLMWGRSNREVLQLYGDRCAYATTWDFTHRECESLFTFIRRYNTPTHPVSTCS
eukprot:6429210-Prymnesium_polylepis.1